MMREKRLLTGLSSPQITRHLSGRCFRRSASISCTADALRMQQQSKNKTLSHETHEVPLIRSLPAKGL
ncbi:uncharacterized protein L969DRAFT_93681 [Mixia osmundae IAM 14324]|uniref:Uncharacterized protein n=1 Tax=Mixia osmundae (strain CBS 9802 / IAM 14324 / JCM 22182 / KY 12970) TaxID=764103 RepID=G7E999_MIXOS|nr:uncharacterized protein L969DRAFT_93681 [Mixia osmundae IAM 14324]KEI39841.1 hypothetical protein L969DRAFT_93681 [Mixia osmundae IAM 14324]GAA99218.1 hypothetical protein E5Q_05911 [Mixia osmundae IAM 14324]